jgi:hypothetical protein
MPISSPPVAKLEKLERVGNFSASIYISKKGEGNQTTRKPDN